MRVVTALVSLVLVSVLGVATTFAAAGFYVGDGDASEVEQTLYGILDATAGPMFAGLIFVAFLAFVASIAIVARSSMTAGRGGIGR